MTQSTHRAAITGYGVLGAFGVGVAAFRGALWAGRQRLSRVDTPAPHGKDGYALSDWPPSVDRSARMLLAVCEESLQTAGCPVGDGRHTGLVVGTVWGDTQSAEECYPGLSAAEDSGRRAGPRSRERGDPVAALRCYPVGSLVGTVGASLGIHGPRHVVSNACASGNIALGIGLDLLRTGTCERVLVAGVDRFSLTGLWGAERSGFVGRRLQPFDRRRAGTVLGEGAGAILLEREDLANGRARAWLDGYCCVCEPGAAAITLLDDGTGLRLSMQGALRDAGLSADQVDYVNAHAPGTPLIDRVECRAVADVWHDQGSTPAVNSTKSITGHLSGASAITELVAVAVQMEEGFIHGNAGLHDPDPELAVAVQGPQPTARRIERAVSNACGGGGLNTSVVVSAKHTPWLARQVGVPAAQVVLTGSAAVRIPALSELEAEISPSDIRSWFSPETDASRLNRSSQLAAAAGAIAINAAGLPGGSPGSPVDDVAVLGGAWLGGWPTASAALCDGLAQRPVRIFPSTALNNGCHLGSVIICRQHHFTGPTYTFCGSISAGLEALVAAFHLLLAQRVRAAVVMGYDTCDPALRTATAAMPECSAVRGLTDGAGAVVLESATAARRRGARVESLIARAAAVSGNLDSPEERRRTGKSLLGSLDGVVPARVLLCPPADDGMTQLARQLSAETGARLDLPEHPHSAAAEPLIALHTRPKDEPVYVLSGSSSGSQVGILVSGRPW